MCTPGIWYHGTVSCPSVISKKPESLFCVNGTIEKSEHLPDALFLCWCCRDAHCIVGFFHRTTTWLMPLKTKSLSASITTMEVRTSTYLKPLASTSVFPWKTSCTLTLILIPETCGCGRYIKTPDCSLSLEWQLMLWVSTYLWPDTWQSVVVCCCHPCHETPTVTAMKDEDKRFKKPEKIFLVLRQQIGQRNFSVVERKMTSFPNFIPKITEKRQTELYYCSVIILLKGLVPKATTITLFQMLLPPNVQPPPPPPNIGGLRGSRLQTSTRWMAWGVSTLPPHWMAQPWKTRSPWSPSTREAGGTACRPQKLTVKGRRQIAPHMTGTTHISRWVCEPHL